MGACRRGLRGARSRELRQSNSVYEQLSYERLPSVAHHPRFTPHPTPPLSTPLGQRNRVHSLRRCLPRRCRCAARLPVSRRPNGSFRPSYPLHLDRYLVVGGDLLSGSCNTPHVIGFILVHQHCGWK